MEPPASFDPQVLVAHAAFVRRLARGLVRRADDADDLAAETLASAVAQRPDTTREPSFRGWLKRVLSRLERRRFVAGSRRLERERLAALPESDDRARSPVDVSIQIELEREIASAFATLDEPCRSTLFRRYWLDLTPTQIAEQTATPLATVKSRLQRGLEQLREKLDAAHGGQRERWLATLSTSISLGGTIVAAKSKLVPLVVAALLVLSASVAVVQYSRRGASGSPASSAPAAASASASALEAEAATVAPAAAERTLDPESLPFAAGIVADGMGAPIEGARVVASRVRKVLQAGQTVLYQWPRGFEYTQAHADTLARSGADGRFAVARCPDDVVALQFEKEGYALAEQWEFAEDRRANQELRVVLLPSRRVRGTVRESDGGPLARAAIRVTPPAPAQNQPSKRSARHLPGAPEYYFVPGLGMHTGVSGVDGRFDLPCVPTGDLTVTASSRGFLTATVALGELPDPWEPVLVRSDLVIDVVDADTQESILGASAIVVARATGVVQQIAYEEAKATGGAAWQSPGRRFVSVNHPRGGPTWLLIAPNQVVDATIHVAAVGYHSETIDAEITAKREPPHLRVELVPDPEGDGEPSITGRVTGAADAEVALFVVQAAVHGIDPAELLRFPPHLTASCAGDGTFTFRELPPAGYLLLAQSKSCAPVRSDVVAPCRDVVIALGAAASLEVHVLDEGGRPAAWSTIHVQDEAGKNAWSKLADGSGIARFESMPSGALRVAAVPSPSPSFSNRNRTTPISPSCFTEAELVEVPAGGSAQLDVRLIGPRSVTFHVLHDDGTPAPRARIEWSGSVDGIARLAPGENQPLRRNFALHLDGQGVGTAELYPGSYYFIADEGRGRVSEKIVVPRAGEASATIHLPDVRPSGSIRGRLLELGSGAPIVGRDVRLAPIRSNGQGYRAGTATTDSEGRFSFDEVPSGNVVIQVFAHCFGGKQSDGTPDPDSPYGDADYRLNVEAGRESTVEIELPPLRSKSATFPTLPFDAHVVDAATGSPIEGASVSVHVVRGGTDFTAATATTGADGRAHVDLFAAERYRVYVSGALNGATMSRSHRSVSFDLEPKGGALVVEAELQKQE